MAKNPDHSSLLRKIRLQHALTQSQFAQIAGVEPKTVQRWESGENSPRPFSIQRLCAHFNATPAELGLNIEQQCEESQTIYPSIRHHPKDRLSPDRRFCCCLLLGLPGCLLCTGTVVLVAGKSWLRSS